MFINYKINNEKWENLEKEIINFLNKKFYFSNEQWIVVINREDMIEEIDVILRFIAKKIDENIYNGKSDIQISKNDNIYYVNANNGTVINKIQYKTLSNKKGIIRYGAMGFVNYINTELL